jgi:hypothetical protein
MQPTVPTGRYRNLRSFRPGRGSCFGIYSKRLSGGVIQYQHSIRVWVELRSVLAPLGPSQTDPAQSIPGTITLDFQTFRNCERLTLQGHAVTQGVFLGILNSRQTLIQIILVLKYSKTYLG